METGKTGGVFGLGLGGITEGVSEACSWKIRLFAATHTHACVHTHIHTNIHHPHQQQLTAGPGGPFIIFTIAFIVSNGHRSKITFPHMQRKMYPRNCIITLFEAAKCEQQPTYLH